MQIEWHQIEQKYAQLRIVDDPYVARLMASLAVDGQRRPVLVVRSGGAEERYVLIDGYARVRALQRLGHDTVDATVLPIGEVEALLLAYRLDAQRGRSLFEEAWLLRELVEGHAKSLSALARELGRTVSWVSRRLALVGTLPQEVQEAVRLGRIPAHAAMRCLVPLARANRAGAARLVEHLGNEPVTVRQLERIYEAWRTGDAEQRERILAAPRLFLKTALELEREQAEQMPVEPGSAPMGAREHAQAVLRQLGVIRAASRTSCIHLDAGAIAAGGVLSGDVRRAFAQARHAFASVTARLDGPGED